MQIDGMNTIHQVMKLIRKTGMLKENDRVIAGVSGGADSVFLFYVLLELTKTIPIEMHVVHVHHGIRGAEADGDADFVRGLCETYKVDFKTVRRDIPLEAKGKGMTLEEAGRAARRDIFKEEADRLGGAKIALAHHENDLAETVLFRAVRGSGIKGLGAMREIDGEYIRPLLHVTRKEIESALLAMHVSWREDSTNAEDDASRNRIRHHILPMLETEVNTAAVRHLAELACRAGEAYDFIGYEAGIRAEKYLTKTERGMLIGQELFAEMPVIRGEIIRIAIGRTAGVIKDIERTHIDAVGMLFEHMSGARADLPYGLAARRMPSGVEVFERAGKASGKQYTVSMREADEIPDPLPEKKYTKWVDYDKIKFAPIVRTRKNGDFLTIDREGHKKSLSDYLTDNHVPVDERDEIPVVADGDEIIWVVGMRIGYRYRVGAYTSKYLVLEAKESTDNER